MQQLIDDVTAAMEKRRNTLHRSWRATQGMFAEVFPHARAFTEASSLTEKDVRTTGVVALSKWSRLLMVSPRSLSVMTGKIRLPMNTYIWSSYHTRDRAPVWHRSHRKILDNRWRDGSDGFHLDPYSEGLLADAVKTGNLVTLNKCIPLWRNY